MKQSVKSKLAQEFRALETACHRHGMQATELLDRALRATEQHERKHRKLGKRVMSGILTPRYALSVDATARYFILRAFHGSFGEPSQVKSPLDATALREDILCGLALRQLLPDAADSGSGELACLTIDYAGDIALEG